ncbi:MAG: YlxR family protein [Armatimonadota bacterium]|nr:YlxR family protein [Armatimonadota bacterium]
MKQRKTPERTCVACRTGTDKKALIRVVRAADGVIRVDPTGKQPGRGAYMCPKIECLTKAIKEKRFDRALRAKAPPTLAEELEMAIEQSGENLT